MSTQKRNGKRWSVNEVLSLQREYELLGFSVQQIAKKHQRSENAILFKLEAEGFETSTNIFVKPVSLKADKKIELVSYDESDTESDADSSSDYEGSEVDLECQSDDENVVLDNTSDVSDYVSDSCVVESLSDRVWSLETSVNQIGSMVKQVFDQLAAKKTKKLAPLRKV